MVSTGVEEGDRIAAVISNSVDAIVLCLAALSLGAIFSSASPDLGTQAIVDRFSQIKPKLIFADNAFEYAGKRHDVTERIAEWSRLLEKQENNIANVVVLPYCPTNINFVEIRKGISWDAFLRRCRGRILEFKLLPFSHPAFILYSSGTVSEGHFIRVAYNSSSL